MEFRGSAINTESTEVIPDALVIIEPTITVGQTTYGDGWHYTEPDRLSGAMVRGLPDGSWKVHTDTHILALVVTNGHSAEWSLTAKGRET